MLRLSYSRPFVAFVAFLGHAPGLRLATPVRFTARGVRINVIAVALTLIAMAVSGFVAPPGQGPWAVLVAWLLGHFAWGTILSIWILAGGAVTLPEDPGSPIS